MNTFKHILLNTLTWPLYFGTLLALGAKLLWGGPPLFWRKGALFVRLAEKSWLNRTWGKDWGGTTLGYGIIIAFDADDSVVRHELVHVDQHRAAAIAGAFFCLVTCLLTRTTEGIIAGHLIWALNPFIVYWGASLSAWLQGADGYLGNEEEQAAYNTIELEDLKNKQS